MVFSESSVLIQKEAVDNLIQTGDDSGPNRKFSKGWPVPGQYWISSQLMLSVKRFKIPELKDSLGLRQQRLGTKWN